MTNFSTDHFMVLGRILESVVVNTHEGFTEIVRHGFTISALVGIGNTIFLKAKGVIEHDDLAPVNEFKPDGGFGGDKLFKQGKDCHNPNKSNCCAKLRCGFKTVNFYVKNRG